ncbi:cofilin [Actinomortierella ambigua]|nr:cofilin [Actinomortierella ambigua]
MSGVTAQAECVQAFNDLKLGKKYKYIIYKLSADMKSIEVEKSSDRSATYDDFIGDLPKDDCRYAVFDFDYKAGDGGDRAKIVFYTWSPDDAKIKQKMVYASSKDTLRKSLNGVGVDVQGTDYDEVTQEAVQEKIR